MQSQKSQKMPKKLKTCSSRIHKGARIFQKPQNISK